jgi:tRNA-dihydrouridine synthase A
MMEYTDRHFRHLVRLVSPRTTVYSEMVAANAISHASSNFDFGEDPADPWSSPASLLRFLGQGHRPEGPSVLQLGGSDPRQLYTAAKAVRDLNEVHARQAAEYDNNQCWRQQPREGGGGGGGGGRGGLEGNRDAILGRVYCDYTALNLNCGCPSPKVAGKGCFGAALMSDPILVRQLASAMRDGCGGTMPITVKCRIGTDDWMRDHGGFTRDGYHALRSMDEEYGELRKFVEVVAGGGVVDRFQLHARIAVLSKDYSPADNRKVPPLRYDHVRRLAGDYPELHFSLNGGIETLSEAKRELDSCDGLEGVMIGRGLVADPWSFATADDLLYPPSSSSNDDDNDGGGGGPRNRMEVLERYGVHADYEEARWGANKVRRYVLRAVTHLFAGEHNAKRYRIALDEIVASIPKSRRSGGGVDRQ